HAVVRRPCPPWREGSSPSLVTPRYCPVLRLQAPALRRLVGQFDSGVGYGGLSCGFRALGLRSPVGRFDSCTTYWVRRALAGYEDAPSHCNQACAVPRGTCARSVWRRSKASAASGSSRNWAVRSGARRLARPPASSTSTGCSAAASWITGAASASTPTIS